MPFLKDTLQKIAPYLNDGDDRVRIDMLEAADGIFKFIARQGSADDVRFCWMVLQPYLYSEFTHPDLALYQLGINIANYGRQEHLRAFIGLGLASEFIQVKCNPFFRVDGRAGIGLAFLRLGDTNDISLFARLFLNPLPLAQAKQVVDWIAYLIASSKENIIGVVEAYLTKLVPHLGPEADRRLDAINQLISRVAEHGNRQGVEQYLQTCREHFNLPWAQVVFFMLAPFIEKRRHSLLSSLKSFKSAASPVIRHALATNRGESAMPFAFGGSSPAVEKRGLTPFYGVLSTKQRAMTASLTKELDRVFGSWSKSALQKQLRIERKNLGALIIKYGLQRIVRSSGSLSGNDLDHLWHLFANPQRAENTLRLLERLAPEPAQAIQTFEPIRALLLKQIRDRTLDHERRVNEVESKLTSGPLRDSESLSLEELYAFGLAGTISEEGDLAFLEWLMDARSDLAGFRDALGEWHQRMLSQVQWDLRHRFSGYEVIGLVHFFDAEDSRKRGWRAGQQVHLYDYFFAAAGPIDEVSGEKIALLEVPISRILTWWGIHMRFGGTSEKEYILSGGPMKVVRIYDDYRGDLPYPFDPRTVISKAGGSSPAGMLNYEESMVLLAAERSRLSDYLRFEASGLQQLFPDFSLSDIPETILGTILKDCKWPMSTAAVLNRYWSFVAPLVIKSIAAMYDHFDSWLWPQKELQSYQDDIFFKLIRPLELAIDEVVLDLGTGISAAVALSAATAAYQGYTIGVDISVTALIYASMAACNYGIKNILFVQTNGIDLPFHKHSFDRVITSVALSSMPTAIRLGLIGEIWRILKPAGRIAFREHDDATSGKNPYGWKAQDWEENLNSGQVSAGLVMSVRIALGQCRIAKIS
jgi:hypothetical protein